MSTIESNLKNQPIVLISVLSQPVTTPPPSVLISTASSLTPNTSSPAIFHDDKPIEKYYKKNKQILFEFDQIVKDIRFQLNEQLKCLEQRIETQLSILSEVQEYFRRRSDVEFDYAKNLDNLHKQIGQRHRAQKARRETWIFQSIYKLWDTIVQDTRTHVKYHTIMSDICGKYMYDKFNEIAEDTRRMFMKCKSVGLASHEDIYKVLNELKSTMKTYHQYQSESKQAEQKLSNILQQIAKIKSAKKQKTMEKRVEKRQMKYTETKVKAFKARNDYLMTIESVNAALQKYCSDDVPDLIDCMNFGFHTSIAKCIQMYLSAQENIKRGRQITIETLNRAIADLDTIVDKQKYLEYYSSIFTIPKRIKFEPHKGDEVSTVNAQVLIRDEMQSRFIQMQNRLASLKTENDEIFKTIEATEQSLMENITTKNSDVSDLFKDLNLPQNNSKNARKEIEDYYVEFKYDLYTREQLFKFCDQGKRYVECVNKRLQCCDLKSEHAGALAAFEVGLQQAGWRLGRYCAGLGGSTIIQYKCKTTTLPPAKTTTTTSSTTSTIPPCEAGKECNEILDDRLKFETTWSVQEKIQWCKAVTDYIQCAGKHITNCSIIEVRDDVEQLSNFMEYIMKQANLNCHGGFYGCDHAVTDVRCLQTARKFYSGEAFDSAAKNLIIKSYLFFTIALIWWWNR
ncbi:unnamed protein product [Rotaria sp. Silwood2]|nr:unnamed protein product [Rotaria sp. Silwood2]